MSDDLLKRAKAPAGSDMRKIAKATDPAGKAFQTFCALFFSSYFFFWPIGGFVWILLGYLGLCSWTALYLFAGAYFLQLVVYKPHLKQGWFPVLLYSSYSSVLKLTDGVQGYYDGVLVREGPRPAEDGSYMFAMYPHGIFGVCRAFSGGTAWKELYGSTTGRWGSFGHAFAIPGVREFSLLAGCLDASKPVLQQAIKNKENIILLPGGIKEMMLTDGASTDTKVVCTDRKGYAKLAIENGMSIVPSFVFGEKFIHDIVLFPAPIQKFLLKMKLSACWMKGRWFTFLGKELPLAAVWGEPIPTKKMNPVPQEYLDEIHGKVEAAVHSIFDRYKTEFGYEEAETLTSVSSSYPKCDTKTD